MKYTTVQIDQDKLGPSGFRFQLISTSKEIADLIQDKTLRIFNFTGRFSKQILFPVEEVKASISADSGSAYFRTSEKDLTPAISTSSGLYTIHCNSQKEFSSVTFSCNARNINEAHKIFYSGLSPFLDYLAYLADCPAIFDQVQCEDINNDTHYIDYLSPYSYKEISIGNTPIINELKPVYSLYREAKNSTSDYYKFLCYYKILEGIYTNLKPSLIKKLKETDPQARPGTDKVPSVLYIDPEHRKYIGKAIQPIFEQDLTSQYRNEIAYFGDEKSIIVSDYEASTKFSNIVYFCEICCREAIRNLEVLYKKVSDYKKA